LFLRLLLLSDFQSQFSLLHYFSFSSVAKKTKRKKNEKAFITVGSEGGFTFRFSLFSARDFFFETKILSLPALLFFFF